MRSAWRSSLSTKAFVGHWLSFRVVHTGEYGADVDLLARFDVEFDEHTVARGGHGVFHLHGLQPDQRLAGLDGVAYRGTDAQHRARHGGEQRTVRDRGGRIGEPRQRDELHRAQRGVDEDVVAVSGDVERAVHAVDSQHHLVGRRRHQAHRVVAGEFEAAAAEAVADLVRLARTIGVALGLEARRDVAPAAGGRGEYRCGVAILGRIRQCGGQCRQLDGTCVGQRSGQLSQAVGVEERGVGGAVEEGRMAQHVDEKVAVGAHAVNAGAGQRVGQQRRRPDDGSVRRR